MAVVAACQRVLCPLSSVVCCCSIAHTLSSALCRPLGSLSSDHLRHAQLKLLAFDHITSLGDAEGSDVVFRWVH